MRSSNQASQSLRQSDVGLVWKRILGTASVPASGTIKVNKLSTLRIRAVANCEVTIDGEPSVSLLAGDIIVICVGSGLNDPTKTTVDVAFSGNVVCSVAKDNN